MHFPKYWARGEWIGSPSAHKEWRQVAWDSSDISAADARERANLKAQRLGQKAITGNAPGADSYPYTDRPVREPVLRTIDSVDANGAGVITRTAYGSEVLNTAGLMFIDIDLPKVKAGSGLLAMLKRLLWGGAAGADAAPSPAESKLTDLRQWQSGNSPWAFRAYRTHSGLRYMVTSAWQDPVADQTHSVFASLGCDTRYRHLCKVQKSFRARLTPKPWRCGCPNPPVRFPYENSKREAQMEQWLARYQRATANYATCQFLANVGSTLPPAEISALITEHDSRTKAASGLPLA